MPIPRATTQQCSAKCTPSIISATKSSSGQVRGEQVGQRRLGARPRTDARPPTSTCRSPSARPGADRLEPGAVAAGRQLGHHPLQRHAVEQLGRREQLIGRHRHLAGAVGGADPRPADRHPPPAQGDRAVLGAVTDRGPARVVTALRSGQPVDVGRPADSCITCKPVPTASASRPSRAAPANSASVTVTARASPTRRRRAAVWVR